MSSGVWRPLHSTRGVTGASTNYAPNLRALPDPGMRFEASAEFTIDNRKSEFAAVGFEVGVHREPDRERSVAVLWYRNRHRVEVRTNATSNPLATFDLPATAKAGSKSGSKSGKSKASTEKTWSSIDLRVVVWDEVIGVFANDMPLGRVTIPPHVAAELGEALSIGCLYSPSTSDDITARIPRFRRLTSRPSELDALPTSAPPSAVPSNEAKPKERETKPKSNQAPKTPARKGGTP